MEYKSRDVLQLSRTERIREEIRHAQESGLTIDGPISLHPNFRVETLTSTRPPDIDEPDAGFLELSRVELATSRDGNPLVRAENPEILIAQIEAELQRMQPGDDAGRAEATLDLLARLQIADPNGRASTSLRRKALTLLFGEGFFSNAHTLTADDGSSASGPSTTDNNGSI